MSVPPYALTACLCNPWHLIWIIPIMKTDQGPVQGLCRLCECPSWLQLMCVSAVHSMCQHSSWPSPEPVLNASSVLLRHRGLIHEPDCSLCKHSQSSRSWKCDFLCWRMGRKWERASLVLAHLLQLLKLWAVNWRLIRCRSISCEVVGVNLLNKWKKELNKVEQVCDVKLWCTLNCVVWF